MPKFIYVAKAEDGERSRTIKGFVESIDENQAAKILHRKNLVPIKIYLSKESFLKELTLKFLKKISLGDVANFTRNISTMITAGLPLPEALVILKSQAPPRLKPVVEDVLVSVEGGSTLADALGRYPEVFSKVYLALVKAGESAGVLDKTMTRLADNLEKQKEFQGKIKGAMIYPAIIIIGMGGVVLIMMIFVIPKLMGLYQEFGAKLPTPTRILISFSNFLVKDSLFLIIIIFGGLYLFKIFSKSQIGKKTTDGFKLKIPLFGNLQKQIVLAEVTRTLGLLTASGIQIVEALNIVAGASTNWVFEDGIKKAAKLVEKGLPLATALGQNENFPQIMPQLLSVGEETGKVDEVLGKISHFFETESDRMLKGLTTAIEPLIMIVLGIGVGFLIIAIILPIYNLTAQF